MFTDQIYQHHQLTMHRLSSTSLLTDDYLTNQQDLINSSLSIINDFITDLNTTNHHPTVKLHKDLIRHTKRRRGQKIITLTIISNQSGFHYSSTSNPILTMWRDRMTWTMTTMTTTMTTHGTSKDVDKWQKLQNPFWPFDTTERHGQ